MNIGHITGFSRHWYQYEFDDKGKLVERLVSHLIDPDPERVEKWKGISTRRVSEPDPNDRILYYTGLRGLNGEPTFQGVPAIVPEERPYVNVGTIGHVDYMGPREEVLSPLQQAIRDVNNGR